jgi:hypothetical protein
MTRATAHKQTAACRVRGLGSSVSLSVDDRFGFAAGDPNLYRYVGNSPTNATDPSGLEVAGLAHFYPLYLGGCDEQPLYELTKEQHTAAHDVFRKHGVGGKPGSKAEYDAARAKWAKLSTEQQRAIIVESMKKAGIPEPLIKSHIDKIMKGAQPGINVTATRGTPKIGQRVSQLAIQEAGKVGRLVTALGTTVVFAGVTYANDCYVREGEKAGMKMVDKTSLMRELRQAQNGDGLPSGAFILRWRDGAVKVWIEKKDGALWILVYKITEMDDNGIIKDMEPYIRAGELPYDLKPGDPLQNLLNGR